MFDLDRAHPDGYNIFEVTKNIWVFEIINGQQFTGTLKEVVVFAMARYFFTMKEIESAVNSMIEEGHNAAHFGMWTKFIYSFTKTFDTQRMVS
jgi:hypothetical protein